MMKHEFLWDMGDSMDSMRLIVEGAVMLFEEDACPITRMAQDNGELVAAAAFNTIGEALYSLRSLVRDLQKAHTEEVNRQLTESDK